MFIHISNLDPNLIESDVLRLFSKYGEVASVNLVRDKLNHRSTGRAFIEMPNPGHGKTAVAGLNSFAIKGKRATVAEVNYDPAPNASWDFTQKI